MNKFFNIMAIISIVAYGLCAFFSAKLSLQREATAWVDAALWAFIALLNNKLK